MKFLDLAPASRVEMAAELSADIQSNTIYFSERFNSNGKQCYGALMLQAIQQTDDMWLINELLARNCFIDEEETVRGWRTVNQEAAASSFGEGEYNRYYMRAICLLAIKSGYGFVEVYRGRYSENTRPESEALIGKFIDAAKLLADLRMSKGGEPISGIGRVNSGLSVRLPSVLSRQSDTPPQAGERLINAI